jgi:hypothetical protein
MGTSYGATRKLFVVASGTTLKGDGRNTCNIITIRHGLAVVTPATAQPGDKFRDKEPVLLPPCGDYIREQYELQREKMGYEIEEFVKQVKIDAEGDSDTTTRIDRMRITRPSAFEEKWKAADAFYLQTLSGRLAPKIESWSSSPALRPKTVEVTDLKIKGSWDMPKQMDVRSFHSASIRYLTLNAWAMNTDEFERKYSPDLGEKQEEEWFICARPIRLFKQVIYFPDGWKPEGEPSLRIYSSTDCENFSAKSEAWLERHLANALSYDDKSNSLTLTLEKPLYGFKYIAGWYLPQPPTPLDPDPDLMLHKQRVSKLLNRVHESPGKLDDFMKALTEVVCSELVEVIGGGRDADGKKKLKKEIKDEPIDISIAIPSREAGEGRHQLEIVAYNLNREGIKGLKFPAGEGVAGRAYKLNGLRVYLRRTEEPKRLSKDDFIYISFGASSDHSVIYSVPLQHPKRPNLLVGVLTIGSRDPTSKLLPTSDNSTEKIGERFVDIATSYVVKRLSDLYGNILDI